MIQYQILIKKVTLYLKLKKKKTINEVSKIKLILNCIFLTPLADIFFLFKV